MPVIETQTTTTRGKGKKSGKATVTRTTRSIGTQTKKNKKSAPKQSNSMDSVVASNHWHMLRNPCHATLGESAYPGRSGITARFTAVTTYTGTTETAFLGLYAIAPLTATAAMYATSATAITPAFATAMPGSVFLAANADSYRVIGTCLTIEYLGTELARAGSLYGGVVPTSAIQGGVATSIDAVKVLLSSEARTPDHRLELLWFPGYSDAEYHKAGDGSMFDDSHNMIVLAAEAMPAGVQLKIRQTVIVEWLPKISIGMSMPPPVSGTNPPAFYEQLHKRGSREGVFVDAFANLTTGAIQRGNAYAHIAGQRLVDASVGVAAYTLGNAARRRASIRN